MILSQCPFCQSEASLVYIEFNDKTVWYTPQCSQCKAGWQENYETQQEAIEAWNTRRT